MIEKDKVDRRALTALAQELRRQRNGDSALLEAVAAGTMEAVRNPDRAPAAAKERSRGFKPDRATITAFLRDELAGGPMPAKAIQAKAIAAGLLTEGEPPPWKSKLWRRAGERLGVIHFQRGREWIWEIPRLSQAANVSPQVTDAQAQAPTSLPQAPIATDGTKADALSNAGPSAGEDAAAARRKFIQQRLDWYDSPEAHALMKAARASVDRYLQTRDLKDLFPSKTN